MAVPDLRRLAAAAAAIHSVSGGRPRPPLLPVVLRDDDGPAPPSATQTLLWETAIEIVAKEMPSYQPTLVHRDYHPGNVLWVRGRCSGVVDWVSACEGPPGGDIAHCRSNLIGLAGTQAADRFLDAYRDMNRDYVPPVLGTGLCPRARAVQLGPGACC